MKLQSTKNSIEQKQTWELTLRPQGRNVIGVKRIFRTIFNANRSINKYKAILVLKGYAQLAGIDYGDTFTPVSRHDTIRLLLTVATKNN